MDSGRSDRAEEEEEQGMIDAMLAMPDTPGEQDDRRDSRASLGGRSTVCLHLVFTGLDRYRSIV